MTRELYFAGAALAVAGILLAVMVTVFGASFEPSTVALSVAAGALMYALRSMFGIVHALARPDVTATLHEQRAGLGTRDELRDEQKRVLKAIKELDFDHQVGKLSDEDHAELSRTYRLRAVELMRALEGSVGGLHPELARVLGMAPREEDSPASSRGPEETTKRELAPETETEIETEPETDAEAGPAKPARPGEAVDVPEKLTTPTDAEPSAGDEPPPGTNPESMPELNTGRLTESTAEARICGACGTVNEVDAKFCKACGEGLS